MCSCINFVPDFHFAGYEFWTICFNILHIKVLVCSLHPFTARGEKRSKSNSTKYTFFRFLTDGSFTLSYFLGIGFHYRLPIPRCHKFLRYFHFSVFLFSFFPYPSCFFIRIPDASQCLVRSWQARSEKLFI